VEAIRSSNNVDNADDWTSIMRRALISGSIAGVASTAALLVLSRLEGRRALQPVTATAHWLYGERAAAPTGMDGRRTLIGYATNHAAAVFWALLFEAARSRRGRDDLVGTATTAAGVSAFAAAFDYGIVPRRLTPGWELAVSKGSVAAAFVALAAGLTVGGLLADRSTS
jgi:hypothetical protein